MEGNPQVILFDVGSASHKMAEFKHELYEKAGIGIPHEDTETNDCAILGYVEMKLWLFIFIIRRNVVQAKFWFIYSIYFLIDLW